MSDSDSSEDGFSTARFRAHLKTLGSQLDKQIEILESLVPEQNSITNQYPLTQSAQTYFGMSKASIEELATLLLKRWKKEGRLTPTGKAVHLTPEEKYFFSSKTDTPMSFYKVIGRLSTFQIDGRH